MTFGELDADANRIAHVLTDAGVRAGDRVAVMLHNRPEIFAVWNGVAQVGALVVPVSYRSLTDEVAYLVDDSDATALFYDDAELVQPSLPGRAGLLAAWHADDEVLWSQPGTPPTDEFLGATVVTMNYTSGTTGRPKGIEHRPAAAGGRVPTQPARRVLGVHRHQRAPPVRARLSHRAGRVPRRCSLGEGGSVVIMPRFTAEACLELIANAHAVTTSHMVPAHFIRILELPDGSARYDLVSAAEDPARGRAVPART